MPRIRFSPNLARQTHAPASDVPGATVRDVLEAVCTLAPKLRGYLLDDQGAVRKHVNIFLDGNAISDRACQSDPVRADSEIFVMQALSGG